MHLSSVELKKTVSIDFLQHKAMLLTLYSTGLRSSELTHLKITDIDSKRMVIRIDQGKGKKDRYVLLSNTLLKILRNYWLTQKPRLTIWLFPGYDLNTPMNRESLGKMITATAIKAGIKKHVTTHTLRHTFATHLLEQGVDIRRIQFLLGHRSLRTTGKYLHISSTYLKDTNNPLDTLDLSL